MKKVLECADQNIYQKALEKEGAPTISKIALSVGVNISCVMKYFNNERAMPLWFAIEVGAGLGIEKDEAIEYWKEAQIKDYDERVSRYGTGKKRKTRSKNLLNKK